MTYRYPGAHAITPQNKGRFPGFDVLDQVDVWDDVTAGIVLDRLAPPNDLAFFTVAERAVAEPLLDLLLAQDAEPRVPVLALDRHPARHRRNGRLALRRPARGRPGLAGHPRLSGP